MVDPIIVGSVAAVIIVFVIIWGIKWLGFAEDAGTNEESGQQQIDQAERRRRRTIPWRDKPKQLTAAGKLFVAAGILAGLLFIVSLYWFFKTGAPVTIPYAGYMEGAVAGGIGVVAGVYLKQRERRGRIIIDYESEDGSDAGSEKVHFRPSEMTTDNDGQPIVYETFGSQLLGIFTRRKLVGHDQTLRSQVALLGDKVSHRIPDHATQIDDYEWVMRTAGRSLNTSPSAAAHFDYRSPPTMSYARSMAVNEQIRRKNIQLNAKDAELAEVETRLGEVQRKLQAGENVAREEALEEVIEIIDAVKATQGRIEVKERDGAQRTPDSQSELNGNQEARS